MFEILIVGFDDLSEDEKSGQPDNGCGKECAGYLKITHLGKVISIHSDAMEPEDCSFGRDLRWISEVISEAYDLGACEG